MMLMIARFDASCAGAAGHVRGFYRPDALMSGRDDCMRLQGGRAQAAAGAGDPLGQRRWEADGTSSCGCGWTFIGRWIWTAKVWAGCRCGRNRDDLRHFGSDISCRSGGRNGDENLRPVCAQASSGWRASLFAKSLTGVDGDGRAAARGDRAVAALSAEWDRVWHRNFRRFCRERIMNRSGRAVRDGAGVCRSNNLAACRILRLAAGA